MFESVQDRESITLGGHLRLWLGDKRVWAGAGVTALMAAGIELGRRAEIEVPIPFLLLLGVVALVASVGGKGPGIAGAAVASAFIFYSMLIDFGPVTVTSGPIQVLFSITLIMAAGFFLGRMRDQNASLIQALKETHLEFEELVGERTAELSAANELLNREIAERIQAEEALRANEVYFRSLTENAMDIVTVLNVDGTVRYESPSIKRMLGYEPEELIGRNVFDFVHPDDVLKVKSVFEVLIGLAGSSRVLELRFLHKDGSWRVLESIGKNLVDNPHVAGAVVNSRDITERREIEQQVQRQARLAMVGQLAAGIAHDFNNVMAVIVLYSQLLSVSPNLTVKEKKQIQTIFNESKRAAELTSQILDFGRKSVLDRQLIDMRPFLEEFVRLLRRTLPEYIEVELTHEEEEDYLVTADATRLQQALMNLALNARDAMPKGGRIRIGLGHLDFLPQEQKPVPDLAAGEWVKIVVSDNGSGISAEEQDHLFEPFYTTKEPGKGTGLGLAQVYGIVKQHNGFIGVESDLGWGTTFTIIIPMEREGRPGGPIAVPHTLATGNGELILIVEDNSATRIALMAALESLNYKVKGADNGIEALILLRRHRDEIALVISDVVMPEMGGIALLDTMEKADITIPAILLTGNSATEEMELVKVKGRVTWYMKPISLEKLGKVVAEKISGQ